MKSPLRQRVEKLQGELSDVMEVLKKEGQSDGERRYKKIMAEAVFLILFRLHWHGDSHYLRNGAWPHLEQCALGRRQQGGERKF